MKANNNWNYERWRTRDRLLEYDFNIVPPHPHSAGIPFIYPLEEMNLSPLLPLSINSAELPVIYPWEEMHTAIIEREIYEIAVKNGYDGTAEHLWSVFSADGFVVTGTIDTFPIPGNENNLYLDEETGILYYFKATSNPVDEEAVARVGAAIVGISRVNGEEITYLYIPVRALLLEDTILNCGDATNI